MTHKIQQESIKKRLAKLAAPIFIETLLIMMLGAVDTIMLSRHSDNSVAAVGVVNQIIMLTFLVFEVINLGTSVLCSQYLGAKLEKKSGTGCWSITVSESGCGRSNQSFSLFNEYNHTRLDGAWSGTNGRWCRVYAYCWLVCFLSGYISHLIGIAS